MNNYLVKLSTIIKEWQVIKFCSCYTLNILSYWVS